MITEDSDSLDSEGGRLRNKFIVTVGAPIVSGFGAYKIVFYHLEVPEYVAYAAALGVSLELYSRARAIKKFRPNNLHTVMFLTFATLSYGVGGLSAYASYFCTPWLLSLIGIDIAEYSRSGYDIGKWISLALAFVIGCIVRSQVWSRATGRQGPIELRKFISQSIALSLTTVATWLIAFGVCLYAKDFPAWMNVTISTLFSVGTFFIGAEIFYGFYEASSSILGGVREETLESAQKKWNKFIKPGDHLVYLFGLKIPDTFLRLNTFLIGLPSSGKSALTKRTYADVLPLVNKGLRVVVLDYKQELPSFFLAIGIDPKHIIFMSPRDKRARPHALYRDNRSFDDCDNFGSSVVPEDKEERSKFFNLSANFLITDLMKALFLGSLDREERGEEPLEYYWRDVVLFGTDKEDLKELLLKHPETAGSVAYLERDNDDCFTTLQNFVKKLSSPAALQASSENEPISFTDWVEGKDGAEGSILHFGVDPRAEVSSKVFNSFATSHIGMHILGQPETRKFKYFLGADEAANCLSSVPLLPTIASAARSKGLGLWVTIQDIAQWYYVTSEMLGKAVMAMFSNFACLKVRNPETAKFMQELIGEVDERYHTESVDRLKVGPDGLAGNIQDQRRIRSATYTSEIMHSESADPVSGVPGVFLNAKTMPVKATLRDVFDGVPNIDLEDPEVQRFNFQPHDNPRDYALKPWTPTERAYFGLTPRPESAKGDDDNGAKGDDDNSGSAKNKVIPIGLAVAKKGNGAARKSEPGSEDNMTLQEFFRQCGIEEEDSKKHTP